MKRITVLILLLLGSGCAATNVATPPSDALEVRESKLLATVSVVEPIASGYLATYKRFGEYFQDKFSGFHTGDDIEAETSLAVRSIADGTVVFASQVPGYGGVIIVNHLIDDVPVSSLYGHLDLATANAKADDVVKAGDVLASLGAPDSSATDGARQHLHFAIWNGAELKLPGYVETPRELDGWINPSDFLAQYGALSPEALWKPSTSFIFTNTELKKLSFEVPPGLDVEYVPSLKALNLFDVSGAGPVRERSQIFIRFFDANAFQTLKTVTIHETTDTVVGSYVARRYEITKKPGVPNFTDQPAWRNERHAVTDFRASEGFTRYYVLARRPGLDEATFHRFLDSVKVAR